ncbi:MAG: hypothetical protein LBS20_09255 [Prevotella sp.]|jgi:hypothetical protein|nr:hypothetical protein [Prevotella sp.]
MTLLEKMSLLDNDTLHLFKEGIFWIAYEQDAYRLNGIKKLKATKKYVKVAGMEVVSVGFPQAVLDEILPHFTVCERTEAYIRAKADSMQENNGEFERWKEEISVYALPEKKQAVQVPVKEHLTAEALYERVRMFRLSTATPMDCMHFIENIQSLMS